MTGLDGFATVELALPALAAGLVVDLRVARRTSVRVTVTTGSLVLWPGYFAAAELSYGLV